MFGKKMPPQGLATYFYSTTNLKRLEIMNQLQKYADANELLNAVLNMPVVWRGKDYEVRMNDTYFVAWKRETMFNPAKFWITPVDLIRHCYHSRSRTKSHNSVSIWALKEIFSLDDLELAESLAIYKRVDPYADGFRKLASEETCTKDARFPGRYGCSYIVKNNALYTSRTTEFTKKVIEYAVINNIQDIVWCTQWVEIDDEDHKAILRLYMYNTPEPYDIECDMDITAYKIAMRLKLHVPHLLYGPSEEYERLFKENPQALMALAKRDMDRWKNCEKQ